MSQDNEIQNLKEVEFYSATVNAWYGTRFEHDKSLLTLSVAAIGLLVTLASTIGITSHCLLFFYVLALCCFVIYLISLLCVFKRNSKHLEDVVNGLDDGDKMLEILDKISFGSFISGVICSSIIGILAAIHSI